jgi:hypothetical protein
MKISIQGSGGQLNPIEVEAEAFLGCREKEYHKFNFAILDIVSICNHTFWCTKRNWQKNYVKSVNENKVKISIIFDDRGVILVFC